MARPDVEQTNPQKDFDAKLNELRRELDTKIESKISTTLAITLMGGLAVALCGGFLYLNTQLNGVREVAGQTDKNAALARQKLDDFMSQPSPQSDTHTTPAPSYQRRQIQ